MFHIGDARIAESTEVDGGVVVADVVHRAGRYRHAGAQVLVSVPAEVNELETELARAVHALQHPHPLLDHLGADAVARNDRDPHRGRGLSLDSHRIAEFRCGLPILVVLRSRAAFAKRVHARVRRGNILSC